MSRLSFKVAISVLLVALLSGCSSQQTELDPQNPITLTMWHVYGEQADSPMNRLVDEFNATVGLEKGVIINVTSITNGVDVGPKLVDAQKGVAGAGEMPDLFFCHTNNAVELGTDNLIDWNSQFTAKELNEFVPSFVDEGMVDTHLCVLPVSKSTHILYVNGNQFDRFSADTGVTYDDLATWDGFFDAAEKYCDWSGGQPFCAMDYLLRAVELNAISSGKTISMNDNWYDFDDPVLQESWEPFANAIVQGHIMVSDLYSNTQVMTGEVPVGLGSSAAILYYNDTVTYADNTSEPMNLVTLPMPYASGGSPVATQAGVGLCAYKTTSAKAEAASLFAHWLTEAERNLDFVADTGYMPVKNESYDQLDSYEFNDPRYANVYKTLGVVRESSDFYTEPSFAGYYQHVYSLYNEIRSKQTQWASRCDQGESVAALSRELWALFSSE